MPLRGYVDPLGGVAKSRYIDNLKVLGLAATDDPYASGAAVTSRMPYGHATVTACRAFSANGYFIERPRVYTRQEMLHWKQCEAYNYFKSGFVRTVEVWDLRNSSQCVILKGLVNSSMRKYNVNSRALDEVVENVAELDRRPQLHGVLEVTAAPDACGSSVAANPKPLNLSKYLDLATPPKGSTYLLKGMSSPLPPMVIVCFCTDLSHQWVWFPLEKARKIPSHLPVGSIYIYNIEIVCVHGAWEITVRHTRTVYVCQLYD